VEVVVVVVVVVVDELLDELLDGNPVLVAAGELAPEILEVLVEQGTGTGASPRHWYISKKSAAPQISPGAPPQGTSHSVNFAEVAPHVK
jgi:hypothetical protein